jgi:hypothetical protein
MFIMLANTLSSSIDPDQWWRALPEMWRDGKAQVRFCQHKPFFYSYTIISMPPRILNSLRYISLKRWPLDAKLPHNLD